MIGDNSNERGEGAWKPQALTRQLLFKPNGDPADHLWLTDHRGFTAGQLAELREQDEGADSGSVVGGRIASPRLSFGR